jgi:predicted dehydrogenase
MIKIAIIGCGWAGERHAHAFFKSQAELLWVVDTNLNRAERIKQTVAPDAQVSNHYQDAYSDPHVDAVVICLPHHLHAVTAVEAAKSGKHILIEKPMAASLPEADLMTQVAEENGVTLMVAENELFRPLNHKVRELLDDGVIGTPALLQITREAYLTRSFIEDRPWFLNERLAAGGIMMSGGVHDFSTALYLLGDVESVYALRAPQRFLEMEGDDTSMAMLRFKNGAVGSFTESFIMKSLTTAAGHEVHTLRVDGTLGSITIPDDHIVRLFSEQEELRLGQSLIQHDLYIPDQDTFLLEAHHFIESLRNGSEPITSGRAMRRPLEIVLAAYQSMSTGNQVKLP